MLGEIVIQYAINTLTPIQRWLRTGNVPTFYEGDCTVYITHYEQPQWQKDVGKKIPIVI